MFSIRINTAADSEATFEIQYEELLVRRRSKYSHSLNLNPGSLVEDLQVEVRVVDPQGVVRENASNFVATNRLSESEVVFSYQPSVEQQKEDSAVFGLSRDVTVEFDVVPSEVSVGEFVVDDRCYFVQFFTKSDAAAVPVDLVFVIDVSGSMSGTKIQQTREALETIINQLRSNDRFTMLTFSNDVSYWRDDLVSVSEYRAAGVRFARELEAEGSTNFNDGLLAGAEVLKSHGQEDHVPLLVMLTDGEPTAGVTDEDEIVANARVSLAGTLISLNCLGFGSNLNYLLLERLALQNRGIVRTIYEGADAAQQLEGFFDEISTPVLRNVRVSYDGESVKSSSTTEFPLLFRGGEVVVAGQCDKERETFDVEVSGTAESGPVSFTAEVSTTQTNTVGDYVPSTERLLAYLLIQQLLDSRLALTDQTLINASTEQALQLSIKYNFVTELTSLIVVEEVEGGGSGAGNESLIGDVYRDNGLGEFDSSYPGIAGELCEFIYTDSADSQVILLPLFVGLAISVVIVGGLVVVVCVVIRKKKKKAARQPREETGPCIEKDFIVWFML